MEQKHLIKRKIKENTVIIDERDYTIFGLNETATRILEYVNKGLKEEEISSLIKKEFIGDNDLINKEVRRTLKKLKKLKLI